VTGIVERARELYGRTLSATGHRPWLSTTIAVVRRDIDVGGTLLAGALAFRLFIWLLPCCLLLTALLGFTETSARSPEELSGELGMSPLTASMLGQVAAQAERGRWVTLILGLVLLAWAGLTLGRALDRVRDRIWLSRAVRRPEPVLARAARYNTALLLVVLGNIVAPVAVAATGRSPALVSLPSLVFYVLVGMVVLSVEWPPRWRSVWPGAVLLALGIEGLHLAAVLFLPGKLARASELYGTLGVAASVLLWLALMARLVVLGQVLNAVLAERSAVSAGAT
jgi:uncharacterized BrkB/YihY/UPF0761 family membrane protein